MFRTISAFALIAGVVMTPGYGATAPEPQAEVSFADSIQPILQKHCLNCHDAGGKKGGVDLSSYESILQKAGLVAAGSPEKSKLLTSVTGASPKMPKNAGALSKAETDAISTWIKAGAKNPPPTRSGLESADAALQQGKDGSKPVVLLFGDASARSRLFVQMISDPSLNDSFGNVIYAFVAWEKTGAEATKYKVTAAPALLILDPRPELPKELKKLTSGTPGAVKSAIAAAVKAVGAK